MPRVFLILAACYATMQLIGILCVSEPTEEEMKEIQQEEDKWKSILEKECNLDWPICAKDVGYKWDVEHFLLYSNRLKNKGRVYVDNYFFDQCSKPTPVDS